MRRTNCSRIARARPMLRTLVLGSLLFSAGAAVSVGQEPPSLVGHRAPEFARPDLQNSTVRLSQFRGKVVLLNFWATWCGPCRLEMPRFVEWQKEYGPRGLQVLGMSIDDSAKPVPAFAAKMHLDYPMMMADATLGEHYGGVYGVPVTFLIDRKGIVRARFNGGSDLNAMERKLRELLAER